MDELRPNTTLHNAHSRITRCNKPQLVNREQNRVHLSIVSPLVNDVLISPHHLRHKVSRLSYVVYAETAFSSVRAWSIWS
jgi:hypothetical protein